MHYFKGESVNWSQKGKQDTIDFRMQFFTKVFWMRKKLLLLLANPIFQG